MIRLFFGEHEKGPNSGAVSINYLVSYGPNQPFFIFFSRKSLSQTGRYEYKECKYSHNESKQAVMR